MYVQNSIHISIQRTCNECEIHLLVLDIWFYLFLHLENILGEVNMTFVFWKPAAEDYLHHLKKNL